jgi:hypothetical protein
MRTQQRALPYGLAAAGLLGLSFLGWYHTLPASAQQEQPPVLQGLPAQTLPPGGTVMPMISGVTAITANNSYVYVLRGNTIMALRANDLAFVGQVQLPMPRTERRLQGVPGVPPGAPGAPGAP